jgi:hypothetical protein
MHAFGRFPAPAPGFEGGAGATRLDGLSGQKTGFRGVDI